MERQLRVRRHDPARSGAVTPRDKLVECCAGPRLARLTQTLHQHRRRLLLCNTKNACPVSPHGSLLMEHGGLREILERSGNEDDLIAFMQDKNLPVDDIEATNIAKQLLIEKPEQGYLTISNALQWRLQYGRAIEQAGNIFGLNRIR